MSIEARFDVRANTAQFKAAIQDASASANGLKKTLSSLGVEGIKGAGLGIAVAAVVGSFAKAAANAAEMRDRARETGEALDENVRKLSAFGSVAGDTKGFFTQMVAEGLDMFSKLSNALSFGASGKIASLFSSEDLEAMKDTQAETERALKKGEELQKANRDLAEARRVIALETAEAEERIALLQERVTRAKNDQIPLLKDSAEWVQQQAKIEQAQAAVERERVKQIEAIRQAQESLADAEEKARMESLSGAEKIARIEEQIAEMRFKEQGMRLQSVERYKLEQEILQKTLEVQKEKASIAEKEAESAQKIADARAGVADAEKGRNKVLGDMQKARQEERGLSVQQLANLAVSNFGADAAVKDAAPIAKEVLDLEKQRRGLLKEGKLTDADRITGEIEVRKGRLKDLGVGKPSELENLEAQFKSALQETNAKLEEANKHLGGLLKAQ